VIHSSIGGWRSDDGGLGRAHSGRSSPGDYDGDGRSDVAVYRDGI
jgi:hypothetical protein